MVTEVERNLSDLLSAANATISELEAENARLRGALESAQADRKRAVDDLFALAKETECLRANSFAAAAEAIRDCVSKMREAGAVTSTSADSYEAVAHWLAQQASQGAKEVAPLPGRESPTSDQCRQSDGQRGGPDPTFGAVPYETAPRLTKGVLVSEQKHNDIKSLIGVPVDCVHGRRKCAECEWADGMPVEVITGAALGIVVRVETEKYDPNHDPECVRCGHVSSDHPRGGHCGASVDDDVGSVRCECSRFVEPEKCESCGGSCGAADWAAQRKCCPDCTCTGEKQPKEKP